MIPSLDTATNLFLNTLAKTQLGLDRVQAQLGTGKRILQASDDPDSVSRLLAVRAELGRVEQTQKNLARLETEVDGAEGALNGAISLFDRVRVLGANGASSLRDPSTRRILADELGSILERLTGLANTHVDGRYLFAGDTDQTRPYDLDLAQEPPWTSYQGAASTRLAEHPLGFQFKVGLEASYIFDNSSAGLSVLSAVEGLRQALLASDDGAIDAAIANFPAVSTHLNQMLTFYGNVQSQVRDAIRVAGKQQLDLEAQLSSIEDADVVAAVVRLEQLRLQQQSALQARSAVPRTSLFDYLR
jgi:flagellar hook-associated protein 3 FlgL